MPFLRHSPAKPASRLELMVPDSALESDARTVPGGFAGPCLLGRCSNPECRSGWIHLFRRRSTPVFEGGWTCSAQCTEALLWASLRRELNGRQPTDEKHRHRVPIGLLMMEHGWLSSGQLRAALEAQRAAGAGRIGEWLVQQRATSEFTVARALGLQWSCPVLSAEFVGQVALTWAVPRLFLDAFGVLPIGAVSNKVLYLGFEQSLDPVLALAVRRISRMQVESAIVPSSLFHKAQRNMIDADFPRAQLAEAISEPAAVHLLARSIERFQPANARLVRVHDCLWLRMWLDRDTGMVPHVYSVHDVICSIGAF